MLKLDIGLPLRYGDTVIQVIKQNDNDYYIFTSLGHCFEVFISTSERKYDSVKKIF